VGEWGFFASMVAVWRVADGDPPRLTFLDPDADDQAREYEEFHLHGSFGDGKAPPLILYSTNLSTGGLRAADGCGHYRVDSNIGVSPVVRDSIGPSKPAGTR
jgi:hypothetical protein